ncbi:unnamed protein product [Paramecium sonneborni]|uniref:Uncharacterized protein n=1 Tax=Paramecium sonneborni TaxID=65129 RepID=A0A8S1R2J9_9CILI|nr:unnamed protein product [Paramecium sonneborni]
MIQVIQQMMELKLHKKVYIILDLIVESSIFRLGLDTKCYQVQNILFAKQNDIIISLKIIDFGFSVYENTYTQLSYKQVDLKELYLLYRQNC